MENPTGEDQDTLNPDEGTSDPDTEEETSDPGTEETAEESEESTEESVDEVKGKLKKQKELTANQRIRAEKAEKKLKKKEGETPETSEGGTSSQDLIALVEAKVHPDDVSEVEEYAKFKGISISEALKSSVMKTLLSEKGEERKTADATSVGAKKRGPSKPSGKTILKEAEKGNLPDDPAELVEAREEEREAKK